MRASTFCRRAVAEGAPLVAPPFSCASVPRSKEVPAVADAAAASVAQARSMPSKAEVSFNALLVAARASAYAAAQPGLLPRVAYNKYIILLLL